AQIIGLSGLITPSLDEMVHVASEMERQKYELPLLIGGATTSKKHTAVKIAPAYSQPTIHVPDASRSVTVVGDLVSESQKDALLARNRDDQETLRRDFEAATRKLVSFEEATRGGFRPAPGASAIAVPDFLGIRVLDPVPLASIVPYIDWTPFFHVWELRGIYPDILTRPRVGEIARELFENARRLLDEIVRGEKLMARAVYGFFPAGRCGDDIVIYEDQSRHRERARIHTLRQQQEKRDGLPYLALADFVSEPDYLGAFVVTAGIGADVLSKRYEDDRDDYQSIMVKALADRLAEALAEKMHEQARRDSGFGKEENLSKEDLIRERYRGIRPAPGYPALPDHTEKATIFELLDATANVGVELTESFAMFPAASVSGLYFNHPEAQYFSVGKIGRDQVEDYARRKRLANAAVERWLSPNLGY
ncbi:MAG: vitamin B12 dependent-methionine synthase activation domain-containing protein, partial [Vicinamibacteria bacterium]